jgi:hypothetical protein
VQQQWNQEQDPPRPYVPEMHANRACNEQYRNSPHDHLRSPSASAAARRTLASLDVSADLNAS